MDRTRDNFQLGRRLMIDAFADLSTAARRAGVDEQSITELHGRFFDGNVLIKQSFRVAVLLAELYTSDTENPTRGPNRT